jgi:hypothetical protein
MIKIISWIVFITALILISVTAFSAQTKKAKKVSYGARLITALVNSDTLPILFRGDSGILGGGQLGVSPDVIRILKLGKRAIPLLIRHLDDKRIFKNMVSCCTNDGSNGDGTENVTVGEGTFFMLVVIIRENAPMFDQKCLKEDRTFNDSIGDCIAEKYYWGKNMKRNWLKAYRAGKIHYEKYEY